jgi:type IV pilus assembly protein PilN
MTINLLPWREELKKKQMKCFQTRLCTGVILSLSLWIGVEISNVIKLKKQEKEMDSLNLTLNALNIKHIKYTALEKTKHETIHQMKFIEDSKIKYQQILKFLDDLGKKIPKKLYLTEIKEESNILRLSGKSPSHSEIALLLRYIEDMGIQKKHIIVETSHKNETGSDIAFVLIYNL